MNKKEQLKAPPGQQEPGNEPEQEQGEIDPGTEPEQEQPIINDGSLPALHLRVKGMGVSLEVNATGYNVNEVATLFDHGISHYNKLSKISGKQKKDKPSGSYIG